MNEILLYASSAGFLAMGAVALVSPPWVTSFFGLREIPADMRNEVRAVYGGFGVAVAALLIAAVRVERIRSGVVLAVAVFLLGMAAGRVVSFALDRTAGRWPVLFLGLELALGGLLLREWWDLDPS